MNTLRTGILRQKGWFPFYTKIRRMNVSAYGFSQEKCHFHAWKICFTCVDDRTVGLLWEEKMLKCSPVFCVSGFKGVFYCELYNIIWPFWCAGSLVLWSVLWQIDHFNWVWLHKNMENISPVYFVPILMFLMIKHNQVVI